MNSNKEIDTIANELNNSVKHQESESVFYQKKKDIIEPKIVAQAAVTLPVTAELDIVIPSAHQPASSPHESLAGGMDEIGGY